MKKGTIFFLGLILLSLVLVTACTTQPATNTPAPSTSSNSVSTGSTVTASTNDSTTGTQSAVKELRIDAYNFGFTVQPVTINKGDVVKIILTDSSGIHGLAIPDFNIDMSPISPGETLTAVFVADKSGTFTYFCNIPCGSGHRSMRGELVVN